MADAKGRRPVTERTYFAYADTAGSESSTRDVMVTAVVVMRKPKAEKFDREWLAIYEKYGISSLHMEEFAGGRGAFASWYDDKPKRHAFLVELAKAAKSNVNKLFIVVLEKSAFDAVNERCKLSERFQGKYAIAIIFSLAKAVDWGVRRDPTDGMALFIEKGDTGQGAFLHDAERLLGFRPDVITKHDPQNGQAITPVQLADFVAYEYRIAYERHVKGDDPRPTRIGLEELEKVPHDTYILDEPTLEKFCEYARLPRRNGQDEL